MNAVVTINVELGTRRYPIWIGGGLLGEPHHWRDVVRGRQVLVVTNTVVGPLYLHRVRAGLDDLAVGEVVVDEGEAFKTLASVQGIFDALAKLGAQRDACIIALGGGVIGDLAGFAGACWMRGIDVVQMPTTLLAMVDASVGGKTGVNLAAGKNLVGAFHQPRAVVIDTDVLATLPDRAYRAGMAEVVKHCAIGDAAFFTRLESMVAALLKRDSTAITDVVTHACRFKAAVVVRDEAEQGERALLNFGHSFAHALETETHYDLLLHGEAVAIGMCLAARLSTRLGMADSADAERLVHLLQAFQLPTEIPDGIDRAALLAHMRLDKKNLAGRQRLVLWRGMGRAALVDDVAHENLRAVLERA